MSLHKQLWIAIVVVLTLVFGISFSVTTLSAKNYLEQQLSIKNADNAAALALSLTQQGADDVLLELTLAAQFDTGFYQRIELTAPDGSLKIRRVDDSDIQGAPRWFTRVFSIIAEPGIASIQAGWQQAGTLTVESHSRFAYKELWHSTIQLALVFLASGILAGVLGNMLLRRILRPLSDVVGQAQALQERRFVNMPEPETQEFKQVAASMNALSAHFKSVLSQEAERLQSWQDEAQLDALTGLKSREPFLNTLSTLLESDDVNAAGTLVLVRVQDLNTLNQSYGRTRIDQVLREIGKTLERIVLEKNGWIASRLNGSDFAVLAPRELEVSGFSHRVHQEMAATLEREGLMQDSHWPGAATTFNYGESLSDILSRLDAALVKAITDGDNGLEIAHRGDIVGKTVREQMADWREVLESGLENDRLWLLAFPVLDAAGMLVHMEAHARMEGDEEVLTAGQFLPWLNRLQLSLPFDQRIVQLALQRIEQTGESTAVNLTASAIMDERFTGWLDKTLANQAEQATKLWLEIPEVMAFRHFNNFKRLCATAKTHGAEVGIEHVGHQLAELGKLHDVGLDYLKVDASFVRNIHESPINQTLIGALCTLGHSIGVQVFAEGVTANAEKEALWGLGVDGATGPGVRLED